MYGEMQKSGFIEIIDLICMHHRILGRCPVLSHPSVLRGNRWAGGSGLGETAVADGLVVRILFPS